MDVRKWLETAADRDAPDPNKDCFVPNHLQSRFNTHLSNHQRYHGRRKRSSNGSFISESHAYVDFHRHKSLAKQASKIAGTTKRPRSASDEHFLEEKATEKLYEKRPRRKTRPDLYEVKPKRTRKDDVTHTHDRLKPKRRKSRRKGDDGARTLNVVQNLRLETGPKNRRLTLNPAQKTAGIFNHGRASSQIAGRGIGLPDLVFNEMRFLQNPRSPQGTNEPTQEQTQPKPNMSPSREKKVSGYFERTTESAKNTAAVLDQPQVRTTHAPTTKRDHEFGQIGDLQKQLSSHDELDILPNRRRPGNGSENNALGEDISPSRDHTCYTWSVSEPFPKVGAVRTQSYSWKTGEIGHEPHERGSSSTRKHEKSTYRQQTNSSSQETQCRPYTAQASDILPLTKSGKFEALLKIHEASQISGTILSKSKDRAAKRPLQPTYRKHSSTNECSKSQSAAIDDGELRDDYRTSDILDIKQNLPQVNPIERVNSPDIPSSPPRKQDATPHNSTPIGRLLRQAQMATAFRSSPLDQYVVSNESACRHTVLPPHSPKLLSSHVVGAKTGQTQHQDHSCEAMYARPHTSSLEHPRTDRSPGPDRLHMGVDNDPQNVLTSLPPMWAESGREELNTATKTSPPAMSAYDAQVNEHRGEHGPLTNVWNSVPGLNQRQADDFAHHFISEPQFLHEPYLAVPTELVSYEQSSHSLAHMRHEPFETAYHGSTDSPLGQQVPHEWLELSPDRPRPSAYHSRPDDILIDFWKPQKL